MPDLFEGFRWKEVITVLSGFCTVTGFFVLIMVEAYRDLDQILTARMDRVATFVINDSRLLRGRVRDLEIGMAGVQKDAAVERILRICAERPDVCEDN